MPEKMQTIRTLTLPDQASAFIRICIQEIICDQVRDLFRLKFHDNPPEDPIHWVTYYDGKDSINRPICYIHFYEWQGCFLIGGACVDQRALKQMSEEERASLRNAGLIIYLCLPRLTTFATKLGQYLAIVVTHCPNASL